MKPGTSKQNTVSFDKLNSDFSDISDCESPAKKLKLEYVHKLKPVDSVEQQQGEASVNLDDDNTAATSSINKQKKLATSSSTSNFGDRTVPESKKRGRGLDWIQLENFETLHDYQASDIGKEIANDFVQHKKYKSDTVYWCRYVKKKDFKCGKKYKLVKKLDGSVDVLQPNENVNHDHNKVSNTRKTNDYASCEKSIKNLLSLDVKTRIIRKVLKDNNFIAEDISKHTFQQKLYREKKKLSQAAVKINYETLKEIIEVNSGAPRDVNEPFIVQSSVDDVNQLRYIMIIR